MKTYKVKNYKGNLVESLSKFQKSHKGMKIVEACEDGDDLKIKTESLPYEEWSTDLAEEFIDAFATDLKNFVKKVGGGKGSEESYNTMKEFFNTFYDQDGFMDQMLSRTKFSGQKTMFAKSMHLAEDYFDVEPSDLDSDEYAG